MRKISLSQIFNTNTRSERVTKDRYTHHGISNSHLFSTSLNISLRSSRLENRKIDNVPYKILDAPGLIDDYYMNVLDWSSTNNIYIGLSESVYQYNYESKKVSEVLNLKENNYTCGLKCKDNFIAVGCSDGNVMILDGDREVCNFSVSDSRICALDCNGSIISCGTKTGEIFNFDVRSGKESVKYVSHKGEICGLRWSPDKKYLASGSNDNTIKIWQLSSANSRYSIDAHKGAVKALAWCPWKGGVLVSGGGTKDKTIKTWDFPDGKMINSVAVNSQVCSLNYIKKYRELVSSHGFSENSLVAWKASTMKKISSFGKHEARVLHVAVSPGGSSIASASGDENLKFWRMYDIEQTRPKRDSIVFR